MNVFPFELVRSGLKGRFENMRPLIGVGAREHFEHVLLPRRCEIHLKLSRDSPVTTSMRIPATTFGFQTRFANLRNRQRMRLMLCF